MKISPMEVLFISSMGSDAEVVNDARLSFGTPRQIAGNEPLSDEKAIKLVKYLALNGHWTPFAHQIMKLKLKAPIFVARQLFKHQVGLVVNEESRRYVDHEPEFFLPDYWRRRAPNIKQGSLENEYIHSLPDSALLELGYAHTFPSINEIATDVLEPVLALYNTLIANDVAPEQARMVLPQNMLVNWVWTGSLAAWARICNLRLDIHAQLESRAIAAAISEHCAACFPISAAALIKFKNEVPNYVKTC